MGFENHHSDDGLELRRPQFVGRRGFLQRGAIVTGAAAAAGAALTQLGSSGLGPDAAFGQTSSRISISQQMRLVQKHENAHVAFLIQALGGLMSNGGMARPKPTFQNLTSSNVSNFLMLGQTLENVGVGAYLGAAPVINNPLRLAAAGSILAIEARHAGMFNTIQSRPMTQNVFGAEQDFERALTLQEVLDLAGPFVVSLNGGPPLTFDSTRSEANDIAILNFALALEYLEAEFYNINVPRFYP